LTGPKEFRKLRSGDLIGFYWLRHTFLTIAEETKDFEACRAVMGHIDARVTGQYRSMVSDERLIVVSDYVRSWLSRSGHCQ
jgi:integrase